MDSVLHRLTDAHKRPFAEVAKDSLMSSLDELVAGGADVHIERMDERSIWIGVVVAGRRWSLTLTARNDRLAARVEDQGPAAA